jgi:myo-inositol-1(or 4)-monophosphatase
MLGPKTTFECAPPHQAQALSWPQMHVETRNSVAYRLALVACGSFDATVALSAKHDWDLAAGDLIVQEAGGRVSTHTGAPLCYNRAEPIQPSLVAAGASLQAQIVARVRGLRLPV